MAPLAQLTAVRRHLKLSKILAASSVALIFHTCYKYLLIMPSVDIDLIPSVDMDLSQYTESILIPYIYPFSTLHVPQVLCTIEGVEIKMPVDTGSTGVLIGAPILPNVDSSVGQPAHHFFTSSKILYVGRLVELPIKFRGEGNSVTAKVPILIVDKSWRCPWYDPSRDTFNCPLGPDGQKPVERNTSNITYMGVGFGRNAPEDGMSYGNPSLNPFLNIDFIDGRPVLPASWRAGYIVLTGGVRVGLTPQNTQNFVFEALRPGLTHHVDPRDWAMARMCLQINSEGSSCGSGLVDTGIAQMYIRGEESLSIPQVTIRNPNKHGRAKWVKRVKPGTTITVSFPSLKNPIFSYSFTVGNGSKVEPSYVVPGKETSPAFVNTGRHFLLGYSVAFDAVGGRFGFRPVPPSSFLAEELI